jgi:long-chain fatty acid transport protein
MKKTIIYYAMLSAITVVPAIAQIDNLTNQSPEWVRSGARNASTDGTDIMVYNPGGVSRLKPGFHITVGNQSSFRKPKHEYSLPDMGAGATDYSYAQDGNDLLTPNINFSYNKNNWAVFGGVNIVGGGGEANFPGGSISTDLITFNTVYGLNLAGLSYTNGKNAYLKSSAYSTASSLGGSYSINDKISFGIIARYVTGKNKSETGVTIEDAYGVYPEIPLALQTEDKASGMGMVIGLDVKPNEKLNLAVRYESQVALEYETKVIKDDFGLVVDGSKNHRDLPAVLGMGAEYSLNEKAKVKADFNYYFQKQANWGATTIGDAEMKTSELAGDASTYSLGFEYKFNPKILWSLGSTYSLFSFKDEAGYFTNFGAYEIAPGNNIALSTGIGYNPVEKIRINFGFTQAIYSQQNIKALNYNAAGLDVDVKTSNSISIIGIGADFLF